ETAAPIAPLISKSKSQPLKSTPAPAAEISQDKEVLISTSPPGAEVYCNQMRIGTTPVRMPAQETTGACSFRKEGYGDFTIAVGTDIRTISVDLGTGEYAVENYR
ncbi:MAG: PEGA domain-containing protein, partial [Bdellovibrionota bacterium]